MQEYKWGDSVSEVAQGLIALQFVFAALVLALVGGLILRRLLLGAVQYIRHSRILFKVSFMKHLFWPAFSRFCVLAIVPSFNMVQDARLCTK